MALENILSQEIIQRLGWTLLHFVWQATAVALLLAILLTALRKSTANVRYIMACAAMGLIVLLPIVTMSLVPVSNRQPIAGVESPPAPVMVSMQPTTVETPLARVVEADEPVRAESIEVSPKIPWKQRVVERLEPALPYLVMGWLIGVFGLSFWHLGGWAQLQRLKRHMVKPVNASLQTTLNELAERLRVLRAVQLVESALVQVPTVVGWLRPMILLPASALTGLANEQLEALLAHELAHIRRYDYLLNIVQTVVETLGFYHPAVWWISHKIRVERENCCDDLAISLSGDRVRYARALASMEEIRTHRNELAVAATGGNLFGRIRRLVGKDTSDSRRAGWIPAVITILLIAIIAIPTSIALTAHLRQKDQKGEIGSSKVVLKLVDPNSLPVAGARVGTSVGWSDTAKNPLKWFLRDGGRTRAVKVKSDKYGKVTLEEGDVFWSVPPTEQKAPITVMDAGHFLAGLQELSREDLGKEVTLTLQPGCRVHGRVSAATARKRQLSPNNLNVWVYWRVHTPCQYASKQGRFDFILPPGKYKLRFFSNYPNNSFTLPILIKPGQRDLDLTGYLDGTSKLPEIENNRRDHEGSIESNKVVLKLVDPNSQPVVGAWVGTSVDWSDVAESPPIWYLKDGGSYKASEIDSSAKVISNKEGKITLTEEELFKPFWPAEKTVPLTAIDEGHYLAGLRELSREDLGTEVTLSLQPGCRVRGRVSAATARKRKWSTKILTVYVYWRVHSPCQYVSKQGRFEFVLPPGKYEVRVYAEDSDKAITLPIRIKPGQRSLDLTKYLDGTSEPPADETEHPAQFLLDKMLEHRSQVKNLQYVAENHMWRDVDAEQDKIEEQIKRMRERGSSERSIERLRTTLSAVPESRYQISKCTTDNERVKIEQTSGTYDSSSKKVPSDDKHVWAWNGALETHFHQRGEFPGSVLIKNTPQIATRLRHPWRSSTGILCKYLEETIAAEKSVSVEQQKDGAYRVAFNYKTSRIVAIVDPSKGYTCTQRENYDKQGQRTSRETAKYEEVAEGIWFPVNGQREEYAANGSVSRKSTFKSSQIKINDPAFNAGYFDVNMPEGTSVRDEVQGKNYVVGSKRAYDLDESQKPSVQMKEVDPNAWQETFNSIYRLEDSQVLKRMAPPLIPERTDYFLSIRQGRYSPNMPEHVVKLYFNWDGKLSIRGSSAGGGILRLKSILESVIGLGSREYDIPLELLSIDMSGDWIVRKDTSQEERLDALEQIIKDETGRDINFVKRQVEDEVIVARGTYRLTPLPDVQQKDCVHVYTDKLDSSSGAGGGSGTLSKFLRFIANHRINRNIIDKTNSGDVRLSWRNHYSSHISWLQQYPQQHNEKVDILLNNLTRQTGLIFKRETTTVEKWFVDQTLQKTSSRVQVGVESKMAGWKDIGELIPPDFNDTKAFTEHINLGDIGQDCEGKAFITCILDATQDNIRRHRFVLAQKNGTVLEPSGYTTFGPKNHLQEKFSFNVPFRRQDIEGFQFQTRPLPRAGIDDSLRQLQGGHPAAFEQGRLMHSRLAPPGRYAIELDGVDDYLLVPDSPSLKLEAPFTVEMWIKTKLPVDASKEYWDWAILSKGFYVGAPRAWVTGLGVVLHRRPEDPSQLYVHYSTANHSGIFTMPYGISTLTNGKSDWIHIAHIFDRENYTSTPGHPLVIGKFLIPTTRPLMGQIGEIRLWNGARTRKQLRRYEAVALTGSEPDLVAWWTFEQREGQFAYDVSDNKNHARLGTSPDADDADPTWIDLEAIPNQAGRNTNTSAEAVAKTMPTDWEHTNQHTIAGIVCDEKGRPIEGVKLNLIPGPPQDFISDDEGRYEVCWDSQQWGLQEFPHYIQAKHEQLNLATMTKIDEDTGKLDIQLKPGVVLFGRVVDPEGKGIDGAWIMPILLHGTSKVGISMGRPQQRTDSEGNFEIKAIPVGYQYWVQASADGYREECSLPIQTEGVAAEARFDVGIITLPEGIFYVTGMVVDANNKPVADATVSINGEGQRYQLKRTDAQGKFTFTKLCAGRIRINAKTYGAIPLNGSVDTYSGATDIEIVVTEPEIVKVSQKTENIQPDQVVLKLIDPNSRPVVGARVGTYVDWSDIAENPPIWFLRYGRNHTSVNVKSDELGMVTLEAEEIFGSGWTPEGKTPLTAIDEGHSLAGLKELSREDLGTEVTLMLQPGCRVHGRVSAATARKRRWSTKTLTVYVDWGEHRPCQYSSKEGRFELILPPGQYELKIYAEDPDKAVILPIRIKPGQHDLDLTKYLDGTSKLPDVISDTTNESAVAEEYEIVFIQYADVSDAIDYINKALQQTLKTKLQSSVLIQPLEKARQIIIFGKPDIREKAKKLLAEIDIPASAANEIQQEKDTSQILIDTRILTVSDAFMKYIGLDPNSPAGSKDWSDYLVNSSDVSAKFIVDQLHAELLLKATRHHKDSKSIIEPRVLARDGKTVEIQSHDSGSYMVTPPSEPNAPSNDPNSNRIKLGTTIRLTPHLTPDGKTVYLDFDWEYRRLLGFKKFTGPDQKTQKVPQITTNKIVTSCQVPDGKTLLIVDKTITESKKPRKFQLADLPFIGILFHTPTKTEETRNLLILIKPVINPPKRIQAQRKTEPPPPFDPDDPLIKKLEEKLRRSDE